MGKYMDLVRRFESERGLVGSVGFVVCAEAQNVKPRDAIGRLSGVKKTTCIYDQTDETDKTPDPFPFAQALAALERRCPDHIEADRWRQCIADASRFLVSWGDKALALGWDAGELFDLHDSPARPHPSYARLSRYDATGLLWLLRGRRVVALTANTAVIETPSGGAIAYRKLRKPAFGPLGDSLDDFDGDPPEAA